ncbi:nickel-responsive transcriptional regulator NikR [Saccharicrinis sp. FJH62]|uniref:nickel-responsive transcriptional regulator NikR n=1 Tax=Saccharicrinis sp. FJH62 TaxID=3344657 RepID=UPI0035D40695
MTVTRFGVSLEEDLLNDLDHIVTEQRFPNRSRALRYLISKYKSEKNIEDNKLVTGAVVLIYDHRIARLHSEIASLKHEYNCLVLSSQHIHLDEKNCIETVAVKGPAQKIIKISNKLLAIKGIQHGDFVISSIE